MRRSPIVLSATIAGTAGVLAFHAHSPSVNAAVATSGASSTPTAAASSSPSATATPSTSASGGAKSATGNAVDTPYGAAQVRVTVEGGKITKLEALQLQGNDPRSLMISSSAEPMLQQEALHAQSAAIDAVSGATFTSSSYDQSLQSALDKLGYKAADDARATLQVPAGGGEHH